VIETVQGDMADLSVFPDARFGLIVHPVSNVFVPDVRPVWRERSGCFVRRLTPGGLHEPRAIPVRRHCPGTWRPSGGPPHPYSDLDSPTEEERARLVEEGRPLEFGHTLGDQIGGQLGAGFVLTGFYEDIDPESVLGGYIPSYIATRALKPSS